MANNKQAKKVRLTMAQRAERHRESLFPEVDVDWIWDRKKNDGFTTIPRSLPIVMEAIDEKSKGQPAGHTLFSLWCRSPDAPVVQIENPATFAAEAGFKGERAVDTWRRRMKTLRDLGFIRTHAGPSGDFHYVLLINPNIAMEHMNAAGMVQAGLYTRFIDRAHETGAIAEIDLGQELLANQAAALAKPT